ncbi:hypothetical protein P153DRAFT_403271 [Dothidotthia symphoricarpi CBS 119687]|uniref:Uncharacterized protein n=1 Tax=Dothidotthia symphoricarpi CBS 119687 TaxID=1392245 RepID=A0A6A6AD67_9PLEO|nr:uncharacterized protein P153DRAFT_403271 [Dothidotthia symphoricarpi CBS 119687]KAF2129496.1 hypothetical protein P153DRAFT_403271 [Dothidotthia symphoricarpi CBS 119687]
MQPRILHTADQHPRNPDFAMAMRLQGESEDPSWSTPASPFDDANEVEDDSEEGEDDDSASSPPRPLRSVASRTPTPLDFTRLLSQPHTASSPRTPSPTPSQHTLTPPCSAGTAALTRAHTHLRSFHVPSRPLSPPRPRVSPKLINAPNISWPQQQRQRLRPIPSFSTTASSPPPTVASGYERNIRQLPSRLSAVTEQSDASFKSVSLGEEREGDVEVSEAVQARMTSWDEVRLFTGPVTRAQRDRERVQRRGRWSGKVFGRLGGCFKGA